jgi:hypothetical protein
MKMVSAAKYAKAEKELKSVRQYGIASNGNFVIENHQIKQIKICLFI